MNQENLTALAATAVKYKCLFENAEPEIGIGPFPDTIVDDVLRESNISLQQVDHEYLYKVAKKHLK